MSGRRTNLALLVMVPATALMGLFANTIGSDWPFHPAIVHGAMGLAVVLLAPWKSPVVRRGLRRRARRPWLSVLLLGSVLVTITSGLVHAADLAVRIGPLTVMQVHVGAGVLSVLLVVAHYRMHPVRPSGTDLSRRSLLRAATLAGAAGVTWLAWESALAWTGSRGAERRATGSHERGSFDPDAFPVTSWLNDRTPATDRPWTVRIQGRELSVDELGRPDEVVALLDCTSGWYSRQRWSGVRLDRLVDVGDLRSVEVVSATGYARRLPARDVADLYLATYVGGTPLSPGHGAPVRLVAPGRRGFWWVKWVVAVDTSPTPWWLQLPFPIT